MTAAPARRAAQQISAPVPRGARKYRSATFTHAAAPARINRKTWTQFFHDATGTLGAIHHSRRAEPNSASAMVT